MAVTVYNHAKALLMNGGLDLDTDTLKVLLVTSGYVVDPDHDFVSQITNELTVAGYARQTLAGKVVTEDDANDRAFFDATDLAFGALSTGQTIAAAVVFKFVTNDADSPLVCYLDFTGVPTNGSTITLVWNAGGLLRLS